MRWILGTARAGAWWAHKLAPLLGTGYATCAYAGISVLDGMGRILLVLGAVVPGAIFVSVLNDLTDVAADRAAGKPNRVAGRYGAALGILAASVTVGAAVGLAAWSDAPLLIALYAGAWVAFALYSVPPARLKARGAAGALADACGAHLLPHVLMAAVVLERAGDGGGVTWLACVGAWALALGVRGALLHQFGDVVADTRAGVRTFARTRPALAREIGVRVAFPLEIGAFAAMLVLSEGWAAGILVGLHGAIEARRERVHVVVPAADGRFALHGAYMVLFPVGYLMQSALAHPGDGAVLISQLALFGVPTAWVLGDLTAQLRATFTRAAALAR